MDANATIRQVITEVLFVFDVGLLWFIVAHLRREWAKRGWKEARARLGNQAAMAVGVHIVGLGLIRAWNLAQYIMIKHGQDPTIIENKYQIPTVGLLLAVLGMSCCIRVFSPVRWRHWGWVLTFLAAGGFVGYMQSYLWFPT